MVARVSAENQLKRNTCKHLKYNNKQKRQLINRDKVTLHLDSVHFANAHCEFISMLSDVFVMKSHPYISVSEVLCMISSLSPYTSFHELKHESLESNKSLNKWYADMPHKLPYRIVGSTGEAEGYPAKNLEEHSPTVAGWQTQRFCVYPQELVIKLSGTGRLKKLQLLAHQYMIPSKIEFYVSDSSQTFKRLGYIFLSSNEKTGFKSRELKSVHVDAEGHLIKLILHKNHLNKFNIYNQVSLMAFNIIGESLDRVHRNEYADLNPAYSNPDYISPMDDLAFDIYQDPFVASIIRKLDARKYQCVKEENFDMAKKIKQAISDLRKVGEKLARYELDKQKAIEEEDYDLAKSKKTQMEEYRIKVSQQLQNYGLLGEAGVSGYSQVENSHRPALPAATSPEIANTSIERMETPQESRSPETQKPLSPVYFNEEVKQSISAPEILSVEEPHISRDVRVSYDDKIIPALQKSTGGNQDNIENLIDASLNEAQGSVSAQGGVPSGEPEPMSEKSIREASSAIDVFGLNLVSGAYSKNFSFREDALLSIYKKMKDPTPGIQKDELQAYLHAALLLLKRLIKDKVHSVFLTSLRLLELILVHFIPTHKLSKSEVSQLVHQTLPLLIHRTGDSAARQRASTLDFITKMASFPNVKSLQIVPHSATHPFARDTATRLALGRVEIVKRLIEVLGFENSALTTDNVMRFCLPALEHTSGEVREAASKVIYQVYRIKGEVVKRFLPPDEPATRKNLLYRNMFDEFDHIDGKPTKAELKAQREAEALKIERKKKDEINQLQSQIEQLRAVNSKLNTSSNNPKVKSTTHHAEQKEGDAMVNVQRSVEEGDESSSAYLENMCIFCGERDDSFNNEGLDLHYWKNCPMLKRCEHCKQVVEIAGYSDHLVTECDQKASFTKCPRCSEAIPNNIYQRHNTEKKCLVNKPDKNNRCPMCHRNIPLGEDSWKQHLMGSGKDACTENARRVPALNHMKAKEAQKKGGTRTGNKRA